MSESKKSLPPGLVQELLAVARYSTGLSSYDFEDLLKYHFKEFQYRREAMLSDEQYKKVDATRRGLRTLVRSYYEKAYSRLKPFPNNRCPECGKKLETKRCLACDIKSGTAHNLTLEKAAC